MGRKRERVLHNVHLLTWGDHGGTDSYCFVMYTKGYGDVVETYVNSSSRIRVIYPFNEAAELEVEKRVNKENLPYE